MTVMSYAIWELLSIMCEGVNNNTYLINNPSLDLQRITKDWEILIYLLKSSWKTDLPWFLALYYWTWNKIK